MRGYIIDSDTWIEYFHHRSGVGVHIAQVQKHEIFVSEVSIAELTYGALHSKNVQKHMREPEMIKKNFQVLPIIQNWARDYAEIRHALTSKGIIIGDMDILIAVTARHYGLTVVTHNTKHFSKIPGIKCVDWVD